MQEAQSWSNSVKNTYEDMEVCLVEKFSHLVRADCLAKPSYTQLDQSGTMVKVMKTETWRRQCVGRWKLVRSTEPWLCLLSAVVYMAFLLTSPQKSH